MILGLRLKTYTFVLCFHPTKTATLMAAAYEDSYMY